MIQDTLIQLVPSAQDREANQELIKLLQLLGNLRSQYPPELLTARRTAFISQVNKRRRSNNQVIQFLAK